MERASSNSRPDSPKNGHHRNQRRNVSLFGSHLPASEQNPDEEHHGSDHPPTIAVLPPSPRVRPMDPSTSFGSGGTTTSDAEDSRRLSWSSDVVDPEGHSGNAHVAPSDHHGKQGDEGSTSTTATATGPPEQSSSTVDVAKKRSATRYATLPVPVLRYEFSQNSMESKFGNGRTDEVTGEGLVKRRTRRRSQTGPPLSTPIQSQFAGPSRKSPPTTPLSNEPSVVLSVENRNKYFQPTSYSASDEKLRQKWVGVLREMFKELAEQSDKKGRTMDKETFLKYFPLPGVLGERLYDLFDADGSQTIDFEEFFLGLAVIYNGTAEERRRFLFNMYDLDGNGRITREELYALLTHIPAAFKVLHQLAGPVIGFDDGLEWDRRLVRSRDTHDETEQYSEHTGSDSTSLEDKVSFTVDTVFSERNPSLSRTRSESDIGLTYSEFCEALEKNAEISDLFNLFYDVGMPDLPVPHDTLAPHILLRDKLSGFFCGREESQDRYHFLGIPLPVFPGRTPVSSAPRRSLELRSSASLARLPRIPTSDVCSLPSASTPVTPRSSIDDGDYPDKINHGARTTRRSRTSPSGGHRKVSFGNFPPLFDPSRRGSHTSSDESLDADNHQGASAILIGGTAQDADSGSFEKVPLVSGWLYKVGRRFRLKHYRFFVLRDRFLYYYGHLKDQTPKKALFLQDAQSMPVCHTEEENAYPFDIHLPSGRVHRLFAHTRRDRDIWVRALTAAARTSLFHDDYQLQSPVSRGAFGVVYRGINKRTQLPVAVKILVKKGVEKADRQFFRTEVAVMRLVQHNNIVRLIDVYDSSQYLYVVMEWVEQGSVDQIANLVPSHEDHICKCPFWSHYNKSVSLQEDKANKKEQTEIDHAAKKESLITRALASERLALIVTRGVLQALVYLHKHNIIHRDLKLENILMTSETTHDLRSLASLDLSEEYNNFSGNEDGTSCDRPSGMKKLNSAMSDKSDHESSQGACPCCCQCTLCRPLFNLLDVKISDFGLAKIMAPTEVASEQLGTLCYAAPEVILGKPYDQAVDLWSLGVVVYHLLSGEMPFDGSTDCAVAESVVEGVYEFSPPEIWDNIPDLAKDFISQLLQEDPLKRPRALDCLEHSWLKERFHLITGR